MPEEIATQPIEPTPQPVESTPQPQDAGAPAEAQPTTQPGSDSLVAEMDAIINPPKPAKLEESKPKKGDKPAPAKAAEPKLEAKTDAKPTKTDTEPVKEKDPVSLRKRLAEIEKEYSGFKLTAKEQLEKKNALIAEYEKREYLTPEQKQRQTQLEQDAKNLRAELEAQNFNRTDAYKKIEQEWKSTYQNAVGVISQLSVKTPEGEERPATSRDFDAVLFAPDNQYYRLAKELFGEDAQLVTDQRSALKSIQKREETAAAEHRQSYEQRMEQWQKSMQQQGEQFSKIHKEIDSQLLSKYPQYFAPTESDETENKQLKAGVDFVEQTLANANNLSVEDRAVRTAILHRWATSFPRMVYLNQRLKEQLEERDKMISELRGTDPGAGGEATESVAPQKSQTTEDLIAEFGKVA